MKGTDEKKRSNKSCPAFVVRVTQTVENKEKGGNDITIPLHLTLIGNK